MMKRSEEKTKGSTFSWLSLSTTNAEAHARHTWPGLRRRGWEPSARSAAGPGCAAQPLPHSGRSTARGRRGAFWWPERKGLKAAMQNARRAACWQLSGSRSGGDRPAPLCAHQVQQDETPQPWGHRNGQQYAPGKAVVPEPTRSALPFLQQPGLDALGRGCHLYDPYIGSRRLRVLGVEVARFWSVAGQHLSLPASAVQLRASNRMPAARGRPSRRCGPCGGSG